jgi:hypothetical protein
MLSTFSVFLLVLVSPERLPSSTDTRLALKRDYHSKTAVRLKECSPKASRSIFKGFGSGFTELHAKRNADTLLDFAIHRRQNETRSRGSTPVKSLPVHSSVSGGRLMQ